MSSILSDINTSLNYGDEISKLYGTIGDEYYCSDVRIYSTDIPHNVYNTPSDITDTWVECIFKDEIVKFANSDIWDDYPINNSRIYDDLGIVFSFKDISRLSDSSKYIIEHLIRIVYMNRSILDKAMNYNWENHHAYLGQKILSLTGDVELNNEIYPLLKRSKRNTFDFQLIGDETYPILKSYPNEDEFDFQVYTEIFHTPEYGYYAQHNPYNIYRIRIKIPFNFNVNDSIKHQGFVVLDFLPRVKKLSKY